MPNRILTNRLSARAGTTAAELIVHADAAGDVIRRLIQSAWAELWRAMRPGPHAYHENAQRAHDIMFDLSHNVVMGLREQIKKLILWSHHRSATALMDTLPKAYLRTATARKLIEGRRTKRIREHLPGVVRFGLPGFPGSLADLTIEPGDEPDFWERVLFPPPADFEIEKILNRIMPLPHMHTLGDAQEQPPHTLAWTIARGIAAGESTTEVARKIRPVFDGSANRAERTARTVGAYVGTERNLATSERLGTLVVGYQVHSAGGENARHDHALRSGTVYYREPRAGQYGMDVMPHPPVDTGMGPHEEEGGIRYNCRCWVAPVLRKLDAMDAPAFTENERRLIPEVAHFADWFETASTPQRRAAAGVRRIATAAEVLGREPTWADLVNPKTGKLLTVGELQAETPAQQMARVADVQRHIERNRAAVKRVAAYGSMK